MEKFKEIFEDAKTTINEGTQAVIIVKSGRGYKISFSQYNGAVAYMKQDLAKFNTDQSAQKLVTKTGDIRAISNGKVEYYPDRHLLIQDADDRQVVEEANYFSNYKYLWDGKKWLYIDHSIKKISDINKELLS